MEENKTDRRIAPLGDARLKTFFIDHLNRIYCAKMHMVGRFPELAEEANFSDLNHAIIETTDDVKRQMLRMDEIYRLLGANHSDASCEGMVAVLEDAFKEIYTLKDESALRDMSILFYMQNIESIEMASFQVLKLMALRLDNPEVSQLITENFDEAKEDRELLLMITDKYISG